MILCNVAGQFQLVSVRAITTFTYFIMFVGENLLVACFDCTADVSSAENADYVKTPDVC